MISDRICDKIGELLGLEERPVSVTIDDRFLYVESFAHSLPYESHVTPFVQHASLIRCDANTALVVSAGKEFFVERLSPRTNTSAPGFYVSSTQRLAVFSGYFGQSTSEPDFTDFPEALFALCLLPTDERLASFSWSTLFEKLGPFAVFEKGVRPSIALAASGFFRYQSAAQFIPNVFPIDVAIEKEILPSIHEPIELSAVHSHFPGLEPDVAFIRIYRTFELFWAQEFKDEISQAPIQHILQRVKGLQSSNELAILKKIFERRNFFLSHFNTTNFEDLFGNGHRAVRGDYSPLNKWLEAVPSGPPDPKTSACLVYYIRCALVHAKLSDGDPFLLGPYSAKAADALMNICIDMLNLVQALTLR